MFLIQSVDGGRSSQKSVPSTEKYIVRCLHIAKINKPTCPKLNSRSEAKPNVLVQES